MMHIKNSSGFMLTEALIAIGIVGIILIPLFGLQSAIIQKVRRRSDELQRVLYINTITHDARKEQTPVQSTATLEQQKKLPDTTITYHMDPVAKESSLASIPNLCTEKIKIQWVEYGKPKQELFAHIVYRPESEIKQ